MLGTTSFMNTFDLPLDDDFLSMDYGSVQHDFPLYEELSSDDGLLSAEDNRRYSMEMFEVPSPFGLVHEVPDIEDPRPAKRMKTEHTQNTELISFVDDFVLDDFSLSASSDSDSTASLEMKNPHGELTDLPAYLYGREFTHATAHVVPSTSPTPVKVEPSSPGPVTLPNTSPVRESSPITMSKATAKVTPLVQSEKAVGSTPIFASIDSTKIGDNKPAGYIGIYSPEARKERLARFRKKRTERSWGKKIKYSCRKRLADARPRVKGRFAKRT